MHYFYILLCANGKRYYGYTINLKVRLKQHQEGKNTSTKYRRPVKLIYYEYWDSKEAARKREQSFKNGRTRKTTIDKFIQNFPQSLLNKFE